ncbi:MAG: patatin-like phospholipase family protein [Candidatus Cloacimonetes bacterium]|nr:patatin-like phospholipase family protein [Candidatus Cloacimonadota bacterium]
MRFRKSKYISCIFFILIIFSIIPYLVFARPKIGVVLSGGGARGIAHIGVLQRLEELDIPIDFIGGTSFGALVASFYAAGYSPQQIEEVIANFNWQESFRRNKRRLQYYYYERKEVEANLIKVRFDDWKLKLPQALSNSQVIINELLYYFTRANYISQKNFLNLDTPLLISATDIVNGKNKIFKNGDLVKILQASLSVPLLFPPVEMDSKLYVDGGVTNNLPIQAMRKMGADFIIASNTTNYLYEKEELGSALKIADQLINIMMFSKIEDELKEANIILRPDVDYIDNTNFSNWQQLLTAGRNIPGSVLDSLKSFSVESSARERITNRYYNANNINIRDCDIFSPDELTSLFTQKKQVSLDSIKSIINKKYIESGYVLTEINTVRANSDSVVISIKSGKIKNIKIRGNETTNSFVIKREIKTKSGQIFNINRIISDVKRVYSTNIFETVSYSIERVNSDMVNVIFDVREKAYGFIRAGLNYNTEKSSSAFLSIGDDNILGYANSVNLYAHFGRERKFGLKFLDDRIFNSHFNVSLEGYFKDDLDIENDREWNLKLVSGFFDNRRLGVISSILDYKVSNLEGQGRTVGVGLEAVFDNYDRFPYPTKGLYRKVSYKNFNKKIGSKYDFQNFYLENNFYFTPWKNISFSGNVLMDLNSTQAGKIPVIRQTRERPQNTFFGFHKEEVQGEDLFYFSPQLRIKLKEFSINDPRKNLHFFAKTGIGKFGQINDIDAIWHVFEKSTNAGYALGLEVSTVAGPVIISYESCRRNSFWYFSIGYDFNL